MRNDGNAGGGNRRVPHAFLVRKELAVTYAAARDLLGSSATRRFEIGAEAGSLLSVLLKGMIESRWAGASCEVRQNNPEPGVVLVKNAETGRSLRIFTTAPPREVIAMHIRSQDCSILTFDARPEELDAALEGLAGGPVYVTSSVVRALATPQAVVPRLTPREREVAQLVAQGLSNGEIAERLVISTHTVRTHLQSISGRLGVSSRGKLAARVHELGL
jgi:DNA-binding CsgD family transcriptional regulator